MFWWHHTWHMYNIIGTTDDITLSLSHQITVFMISHPLQAWHHSHCIRHHIHCIFSSQTLHWYHTHVYMTPHPPYVCHHIHSIQHLIRSLHHHITYLWHHNLYIQNHIQYVGQHTHYTCDIMATNLCHHTHSLYDITLGIWVANFALYKTSHPHFMTSNHRFYDITPTIFDIVSTVSL